MAARKQSPKTVLLDGRRVTVVHTATTHWTELLASGRIQHHVGRLLADQVPGRWLAAPKPCSRCKLPTQYATPRGRAVHPTCEGWCDVLPDEVYGELVFDIAADLCACLLTSTPAKENRRAA